MSLFYNRDRNISGLTTLTSFDFSPNYGSSIQFNCKNNRVNYTSNTYALMPSTLNNIQAKCSFGFTMNQTDAQKAIDFFESQSGTGAFAINDDSSIYHSLTGFADSFGITMVQNNLYNVALEFSVERNSTMLNWSGMGFVDYSFTAWTGSQNYLKYQVAYFPKYEDKFKNYFYCTGDHSSSANNSPTGVNSMWTQELFYDTEIGLSVETVPSITKTEFRNSFIQRVKEQENIHSFQQVRLSYKNISTFQLKSMLHFLESHLGYRKFQFNCPKIYNRPKIYYCESWQHTWNYEDSHNLEIVLIEDPLGILKAYKTV
jgi:phage-related protein